MGPDDAALDTVLGFDSRSGINSRVFKHLAPSLEHRIHTSNPSSPTSTSDEPRKKEFQQQQGQRCLESMGVRAHWRSSGARFTLYGELPAGRGGPDGTKEQVGSSPAVQRLPGEGVMCKQIQGPHKNARNWKLWQRSNGLSREFEKKMAKSSKDGESCGITV